MAYESSNLSALSYANGFTLWHYRSDDMDAVIDDAGYFDEANRMLRVGDFILVNAGVGTSPTHGMMVVVGNSNGRVDVSNISQFGSLNAD